MKKFETPEIKFHALLNEDVICASIEVGAGGITGTPDQDKGWNEEDDGI